MDKRCKQTDAEAGVSPKSRKDIETLKRFLYRNQQYRFTETDRTHLMEAIKVYYTHASDLDEQNVQSLLEDALKMPSNVFNTAQKKQLLKWYYQLSPDTAKQSGIYKEDNDEEELWELCDVSEKTFSAVRGDETLEDVKAVTDDQFNAVRAAFEDGKTVMVKLTAQGEEMRIDAYEVNE